MKPSIPLDAIYVLEDNGEAIKLTTPSQASARIEPVDVNITI